jgi:hypothetical protein
MVSRAAAVLPHEGLIENVEAGKDSWLSCVRNALEQPLDEMRSSERDEGSASKSAHTKLEAISESFRLAVGRRLNGCVTTSTGTAAIQACLLCMKCSSRLSECRYKAVPVFPRTVSSSETKPRPCWNRCLCFMGKLSERSLTGESCIRKHTS